MTITRQDLLTITQCDSQTPEGQAFATGDLVKLTEDICDMTTEQRFRIVCTYAQRFPKIARILSKETLNEFEIINVETGTKHAWILSHELELIPERKCKFYHRCYHCDLGITSWHTPVPPEGEKTEPRKENNVSRDAIKILEAEVQRFHLDPDDHGRNDLIREFVTRVKLRLTREMPQRKKAYCRKSGSIKSSQGKHTALSEAEVSTIVCEHFAREHHRDVKVQFVRNPLNSNIPGTFLAMLEDI